MRRRPSGSAEEDDDTGEAVATEPPHAENGGIRRSFTTAKDDVTRHSDTLDRRKVEKLITPAPVLPNGWKGPTAIHGPPKRPIPPLTPEQSVNPMAELRAWRSRMRSPWSSSWLILSATALALLLLFSIIHSFATRQLDSKGCDMYYTRSIFFKFADFDTEHTRFATKYSLHLYREGGFDEDAKVKGVPVLFIPGNAGSYKQARSLASESAQYFYNSIQQDAKAMKEGATSIDFFSIDFNEDYTALHGQTLLDQAEYLNDAVAYILSLYHDPRRSQRDPGLPDPSSVVLVGHSMGGIAARTMLTMPNYQSNSVNTIITISAPHARPPVSVDADIVRTYKQINDYWRQAYSQKWANDNPLWHVTLISVAGGSLDTVVPSDYSSLSSLVPSTHGFTVFTSSIPNMWTGADHIQTTWCVQLVRPIIRSLLETIDVRRPGQTKPRAERMRIFKKWYLTGMEDTAEKTLLTKEPTTLLTLEDNSNSFISKGERLVLKDFGRTEKPKAHLIPIPLQDIPGLKRFTLLSNLPLDDHGSENVLEILFCSVFPLQAGQAAMLFSTNMDLSDGTSGSTRLACKNAASDNINLPASTRLSKHAYDRSPPFSYLQYQLEDLAEHQFVAVVDKASELIPGWVIAEFSDMADSVIHSQLGLGRLLARGMHLKLPAQRATVMEVQIPAFHSSLLAFHLALGKQACGDDAELFTPLLRQHLSEPHESRYFVNLKEANISLHGIAPFMPPPLREHATSNGVSLQFWSDPTCNSSIDVTLKVDISGSMGKLVMRYRMVFAAFPLLIIALVLRKQFKVYDQTGTFITFAESMDLCLKSSLPLVLLALSFLAMSLAVSSSAPSRPASPGFFGWKRNATESAIDYTKNDLLLGSQDPIFWFLVPLLGLISSGLCILVNWAALGVTALLCIPYSLLTARPAWARADDEKKNTVPGFAASSPRSRFVTALVLLLLVSSVVPYQFAYLVACIVQVATCTRALRLVNETRSGANCNFYNYTHSILILMLWVLPINIPVLLVWVHNLAVHWFTPFSSHHNVLSIMPFIMLVETLTCGKMVPRVTSNFRYITNILFFLLAVYAAVYGVTYAYLLHHLVNFVSAWLVAVHFSGSDFSLQGLTTQLFEGEGSGGDVKKRP